MQKREIYTDGPFKGLPIKQNDTWLADIFLDKANNDKTSRKAKRQAEFVEYFAEGLEGEDSDYWAEELSKVLINKRAYRPPVVCKNKEALSLALEEFLITTYEVMPAYAKSKYKQPPQKSNPAEYFLHWLVKNLTNSDSEDVISYVKRYTSFTRDTTFSDLNTPHLLFSHEDVNFYCVNVDEYECGLETPYVMLFWAEDDKSSVVLPFIRYGIEETNQGKTAYIYAIQRREHLKIELEKKLDRMFAKANSGIKENRDATPSMLHVLSCFLGMLHSKGIEKVKAPDFIIRRWGDFWGSDDKQTDDRIQYGATNKFLKNFARIERQFNGIEITEAFDFDSFLHLKLHKDISTTYPTLDAFFTSGKNVAQVRDQTNALKKPTHPKSPEPNEEAEK